jgi:hypothetical protein
MPRYKLRTLLILLAIGPPMLAAPWLCVIRPFMQIMDNFANKPAPIPPNAEAIYRVVPIEDADIVD